MSPPSPPRDKKPLPITWTGVSNKGGVMREFLGNFRFWPWEPVRWHWWEIIVVTFAVWSFLALVLTLVNLAK